MCVLCWWASSAGDVRGLKYSGIVNEGICWMKFVSRGVTAGETSGVKSIFRENTSVAVNAKKFQQII